MIAIERWKKIIMYLNTKGYVSVNELVKNLNTSPATIRRDLQTMEEKKMLVRIRGGAQSIATPENYEDSMDLKTYENTDAKIKISKKAAGCVKDNDCIFIDAGSTTLSMINFINASNITVVTNSIQHIQQLAKKQIKTYLLGGFLKINTGAIVGEDTLEKLRTINFDKAFIGANGIDKKAGFSTADVYEADIKRNAINCSKISYILADASKFGIRKFATFAYFHDATLITDKEPDFDDRDLKVIIAD